MFFGPGEFRRKFCEGFAAGCCGSAQQLRHLSREVGHWVITDDALRAEIVEFDARSPVRRIGDCPELPTAVKQSLDAYPPLSLQRDELREVNTTRQGGFESGRRHQELRSEGVGFPFVAHVGGLSLAVKHEMTELVRGREAMAVNVGVVGCEHDNGPRCVRCGEGVDPSRVREWE